MFRPADLHGNQLAADMDTVIQRLRASKLQHATVTERIGRAFGAAWAKEDAEYGELQSLAEKWPEAQTCETNDAFGAPGVFLRMIRGDEGCSRTDINDFWDHVTLGSEDDQAKYSAEWWNGFVAGALEVYEEVKDKL